MSRYCSVPLCNSWEKKHRDLSFHMFPKPGQRKVKIENKMGSKSLVDQQKTWILKLKIGKPVTNFMRVCSLHFTENDYFNRAENSSKKRTLKRTAVPSQKLPMKIFQVSPGSSSTAEKEKKRIAMKEKVSNQQEISIDCEENGKASHSQEDIGAARGEDVEQNSKHLFEPSPDQNEKVLRNILQPNKKTQSAPRPDSNLDFDPLELNNLLLSTTSIFLGMCKELEMTTKMNENIVCRQKNTMIMGSF